MRKFILIKTINIYDLYIPKGTVLNENQWIEITGRCGGFDLKIGSDKNFFKLYTKNNIKEKIALIQAELNDLINKI